MKLEQTPRRVLGAVRFIDVNTKLRIAEPLWVQAAGVRFVQNRSGYYVVMRAKGLDDHRELFDGPPDTTPLGSLDVELKVVDPAWRYLPRRARFTLPRDAEPDHAGKEDSLFRPIDVALFPSPAHVAETGATVIRATVIAQGSDPPVRLPGVLIRVLRASDDKLLSLGMSDWRGRPRGEATVIVPGIPVTTWGDGNGNGNGDNGNGGAGDGPVLVHETLVILEVVFDAAFQPVDRDLIDPNDPVPDPDSLQTKPPTVPTPASAKLVSGRELPVTLQVPMP